MHLIGRRNDGVNLRTRLLKIIRRAGLSPWPKPFQNMRASRETELADEFPSHVVSAWIGNSERVAAEHYLQVTEDHWRRAAASGAVALQNPVQQAAAPTRTDSQESPEALAACEVVRNGAGIYDIKEYARRDSNPQPAVPKTAALSS